MVSTPAASSNAGGLGTKTAEDDAMTIRQSHERSEAHGLDPYMDPDFSPLRGDDLLTMLDSNRSLYTHALPVMETLYEQIINTHNLIVLTDSNGLILHSIGDPDFTAKADRVALQTGVAWSEESKGTNAIGTALVEQRATLVHADEHFLTANHFLTCSASPIFNHKGNVVGVLDVSGDKNSFHKHTMGLVRMSAQMIENHMFEAEFADNITLHFHSRPEFIGTLMEGMASFSPSGKFLSANRSGMFQLGLPLSALHTHTFSSLFGLPISALIDHQRTAQAGYIPMCLHSGVRVFAKASLNLPKVFFTDSRPLATPQGSAAQAEPAKANRDEFGAKTRKSPGLAALNTGDAQVATVLQKVGKVLGRDIPILITGETGTGKELLAQAIHNDSPRNAHPFVAVNCASIPETLIESELFGYEEGAFTGAKRKGSIGKIIQANGGTLFLDEIGDMPKNLQARLLRVLQERVVTPLGSCKSIPVNVAIVCATHRNLRNMIASGEFREDLYYRLNGLVVKLPPLRERTDIEVVIRKLINEESDGPKYTVDPAVMHMFKQHNWPGNLRQLINLLRTGMVMVDDDNVIRAEHLPDDFIEDFEKVSNPPVHAPGPGSTQTPVHSGAYAATASDQTTGAGTFAQPAPEPSASLEDAELSIIRRTLETLGGNVSAAARALGVSRNTIYRKITSLGQTLP
jgi:transcriptional regulator of acetoin/glycerol metabolism